MTNTANNSRRVAIIGFAGEYAGPATARLLAQRGHDLVLGEAAPSLVEELEALGTKVVNVTGLGYLLEASASQRLVDAAISNFDRLDSATTSSGAIVIGRFLKSSIDDFHKAVRGCMEVPYHFLKAVVPTMIERGGGQVLIQTSASGGRATPGAPLYSMARAGANHLVKNVAAEVAEHKVQVNAVGTNFMDFPGFLKASNAETAEGRAKVEAQVPLRRLGTMEEFAAFCCVFIDGTSGFTTGQFVPYAGGWA